MSTLELEQDAALRGRARRLTAPFRSEYPFEPRFLALEGATLHYVDEGPRDAEPLLFLHGNPTWSFYWRAALVQLRTRYRVIAPDHVGCGLSDKPQRRAYTLAQRIDDVERLVVELGLERLTLVVHDWGGAIGMGLAARQRQRVARLVVTNTAAFPSPRIPLRIAVCRIPLLGLLAVRGLNGFARAATLMAVEQPLSPALRRAYLAPYDSFANRIATHEFVRDIPLRAGHRSWDTLCAVERSLEHLRDRPMLLAWGERDWCFTSAFRAEWQQRFPAAEVRLAPDAGHYLMEDAGERVVGWIEDFLARHPLP